MCCCEIQSAPVRVSPPAHLAHWQGLFTGGGAGWEEGEHTRTHTYTAAAAAAVHARRDLESVYSLPLCACGLKKGRRQVVGKLGFVLPLIQVTSPLVCVRGRDAHLCNLEQLVCFSALPLNSKDTLPARSGVLCESCKALSSPSVEARRTNLCTHQLKRRPHSWSYSHFPPGPCRCTAVPHTVSTRCNALRSLEDSSEIFFFFFFLQGKDTYATHATSTESAANGSKKNSQQPKLHVAVEFLYCTQ